MFRFKDTSRFTFLKSRGKQTTYFLFAWVLSVVVLLLFCITINNQYRPEAFVKDGLYSILRFQSTPLQEYLSPFSSKGHFRPITVFAFAFIYSIAGYNVTLIGYLLIGFNFLLSLAVYFIATKISGRFLVGFCAAFCFLASHLAYYQIMETFGFMEGLALLFALCLLYQLYKYINDLEKHNSFYAALIFYLLASLTHERYFVLFPIFPIAILARNLLYKNTWKTKGQWVKLLLCSMAFILLILARILLLGQSAMSGTDGTNVLETFNVKNTLESIVQQILFLFGVSCGPTYLVGVSVPALPVYGILLIGIYAAFILCIVIWVAILLFKKQNLRKPVIINVLLFMCFIAGCIVSSSTTVRLEIRWIYVSQAAFLLLMAYLIKIIMQNGVPNIKWKALLMTIPILFSMCFSCVEVYYRQYWPNLYMMEWVNTSNSLYETIVKPYGKELDNREVVFINERAHPSVLNSVEEQMSEYFLQFGLTPSVTYINSFYLLTEEDFENRNILIYCREDMTTPYIDITGIPLDLSVEKGSVWNIYNIHEDGWIKDSFSFWALTDSGTITLDCIAARAEPGDTITITVNGEATIFDVDSLFIAFTVKAAPSTLVYVEVESNFSVVSPPDVRPLSIYIGDILVP